MALRDTWYLLPPNLKSRLVARMANNLRQKVSIGERKIMDVLLEAGYLHHQFQKSFHTDEIMVFADFYIRKPIKLIIEIDGLYHLSAQQQKRDREKDWFYINNKNIDAVLRMTEQQAIEMTPDKFKQLMKSINKGSITVLYDLPKSNFKPNTSQHPIKNNNKKIRLKDFTTWQQNVNRGK